MAKWVSDGSAEIEIENGIVRCSPTGNHDNVYGAMWLDLDGGLNSGEHYWKVHFKNLQKSAWVGLSNKNYFKKGYAGKGLFYGGNLSDGGGLLVQNFGPRISGNDTIGLLVSFSGSKLRIYFDHESTPLGLAFDVDASILPDAFPVIRFCSGSGSANIEKQMRVPRDRLRVTKRNSSIEGPWQAVMDSIKLDGEAIAQNSSDDLNVVTMKITSEGGDNKYNIHLRVTNHISFSVVKEAHSWKGTGGGVRSTMMGSTDKNLRLERGMTDLCETPDDVTFNNINQMTLSRGQSVATFVRYDDSPRPVTRNPF